MNANSHPIKTVSVADEGMYANNHPYKVVVEGGPGGNIGKVVDTLPEVGEPGFIYLVLKETTSEGDIYDEYIWVQKSDESFAWEHLGATNEVTVQLYSTYGQNTDGAMTQKATTDLVYTSGDPTKINIGDNGATGGTNSIIIGSEDSGTITGAADQVIIGHNITDSASESVAVGHDITVGPNCVAVGRHTETGTTAAKAYGVAIGYYSKATGASSVAIGNQKYASGSSSIIIGGGMGGSASADYAIVIGDGGCQSQYGISIGHNAGGRNGVQSAICIGNSTQIYSKRKSNNTYYTEGGVALGSESIASQTSVSIGAKAGYEGYNVDPNKRFTVALGSYSLPRAEGVVDVSLSGRPNSSADYYGYDGSAYRVISGVHDPDQAQDAATKNYVDTQVGNIETILQTLNSGTGV